MGNEKTSVPCYQCDLIEESTVISSRILLAGYTTVATFAYECILLLHTREALDATFRTTAEFFRKCDYAALADRWAFAVRRRFFSGRMKRRNKHDGWRVAPATRSTGGRQTE